MSCGSRVARSGTRPSAVAAPPSRCRRPAAAAAPSARLRPWFRCRTASRCFTCRPDAARSGHCQSRAGHCSGTLGTLCALLPAFVRPPDSFLSRPAFALVVVGAVRARPSSSFFPTLPSARMWALPGHVTAGVNQSQQPPDVTSLTTFKNEGAGVACPFMCSFWNQNNIDPSLPVPHRC